MKFYKNLYIGETVGNPDKIKRKLKKHAKMVNVYLIAYVEKEGRLEIFHSLMLQQYFYRDNPPYVVGLAGSREEANGIIGRIAEEAVRKTGSADLVAYLFPDARP